MKYKCDTKYLVGVPNFYRQLFHFRYELHSRPPEGADEILDEYLWYYRSILIDKKTIFFKSWNEGDIKRISDVMKFNGLICSKEDLANEFGIHIEIMKYNSLISAISSKWKQCVKKSNISCFIIMLPNLCYLCNFDANILGNINMVSGTVR